LALLARR